MKKKLGFYPISVGDEPVDKKILGMNQIYLPTADS